MSPTDYGDDELTQLLLRRQKEREDGLNALQASQGSPIGGALAIMGGGLGDVLSGGGTNYMDRAGAAYKQANSDAYQRRLKALDEKDQTIQPLVDLAKIRMTQNREDLRQKKTDERQDKLFGQQMALLQEKLGASSDKFKPNQYQAATYGQRAVQAEQDFSDLAKQGYDPTTLTSRLGRNLPDVMMSEQAKRQDQAERNFVNAILRRESGAAISSSEFQNAENQYFPRAGDTPSVLSQKAKNRQIAEAALKAEASGAWDQVGNTMLGLAPAGISGQGHGGLGLGIQSATAGAEGIDPAIAGYAKMHGLDYPKAEAILRKRGYGR
jgi:hypothetical protein